AKGRRSSGDRERNKRSRLSSLMKPRFMWPLSLALACIAPKVAAAAATAKGTSARDSLALACIAPKVAAAAAGCREVRRSAAP
ncbi:MAG: hypothetical protein QM516_09575, partial [Limnohabitans sp.]|nr:hypothetical protein [Limnohabitans sp.]